MFFENSFFCGGVTVGDQNEQFSNNKGNYCGVVDRSDDRYNSNGRQNAMSKKKTSSRILVVRAKSKWLNVFLVGGVQWALLADQGGRVRVWSRGLLFGL